MTQTILSRIKTGMRKMIIFVKYQDDDGTGV